MISTMSSYLLSLFNIIPRGTYIDVYVHDVLTEGVLNFDYVTRVQYYVHELLKIQY